MTSRVALSTLAMGAWLLVGCAGQALPPALPDDRIRFAPTAEHPLEEPGYATPQELAELVPPLPVPVPPRAVLQTPLRPERRSRRAERERRQNPEQLIRSANTEATVGPSRAGFRASAIMRYDYNEDSIYEVYAAPNAPAFLRLPPGHHLGVPLSLDPDEKEGWVTSKVEMTLPGDISQEGWLVRPAKAGLDAYINLISKEGFVAKCHLRSFEKTAMLEVAWNWTAPSAQHVTPTVYQQPASPLTSIQSPPLRQDERQRLLLAAVKTEPAKPPVVKLKAPSLNLERLHTGYTIAVIGKHTPPWTPVSVMDDGTKSIIKFKENLGFTSAPDLFAIHPDKSPAPVEFTPYISENGETMLYVVPGLFAQLTLRGRNGLEVVITRVPNGTQK